MAEGIDGLDPAFAARVRLWLDAVNAQSPGAYVISGRRSSEEQWQLRKQNCPDPLNSPSSDCSPPTAPVGSSRHEQGLAVDIAPGAAYSAAGALAAQYGLWAPVGGEPWHFEALPGAVDPGGGGLLDGAGSAAGALIDASGVGGALTVARFLGARSTWVRAAYVTLGGFMVLGGLLVVGRGRVREIATTVVDAVPGGELVAEAVA